MATPNLVLPELVSGQSGAETTHNQALRELDVLLQGLVLDRDLTTPPVSPSAGDTYIPLATATGVWTGHENDIAWFDGSSWQFKVPNEGWEFRVADEDIRIQFDGAAWVGVSVAGGWQAVGSPQVLGSPVSSVVVGLLDATAELWEIRFRFWMAVNASVDMRVRLAGGSIQTGSNYHFHVARQRDTSTSYAATAGTGDDRIRLASLSAGTTEARPVQGIIRIHEPGNANSRRPMEISIGFWDSTNAFFGVMGWGVFDGTTAIDQIQFFSAQNFATGSTWALRKRADA